MRRAGLSLPGKQGLDKLEKEQEVTEVLDAVIWGRRIVEVKDAEGEEVMFVFRPLTVEERNMGNYVREKAERDAIARDVLTREQLTKQAIEYDLWKSAYKDDLKSLREELAKQTDALKKEEADKMLDSRGRMKRQTPTAKFVILQKRVSHIGDTIRTLEDDHTKYIELPSAEYQAACKQGDYLLRCATLSFPEMEQKWQTLDDLQKEQDTTLIGNLMREFYSESIVSEAEIRRVARCGFWRCKWMGAKKNRGVKTLFGREMFDLTLDQFRLVYWSQVYDSAYESMEAPSDTVIEDDKLFDRWLEEQQEKRKQERKKSAFDKKVAHLAKNNSNEVAFNVQGEFSEECTCGVKEQATTRGDEKLGHIHDPSCPHGVFIYYDEEKKTQKVEEIQSANPENIRRILGSEQKRLAAIGEDGIEEQSLRGDKSRTVLGLSTKTHGPGEYGKNKGHARPQ